MSSIDFDKKAWPQISELNNLVEDKKTSFEGELFINNSKKEQVCNTCRQKIGTEISRFVMMRDKDGGPRLFLFHFFFPCWDFEQLCQNHPDLIIDKAGFSIPENIKIKENSIMDLQKNLEFWN